MSHDNHLSAIFAADRKLRESEKALLETPPKQVVAILQNAIAEAKAQENEAEGTMRLQRLSDLCAQVPGPQMADALIDILNTDLPTVRVSAAEALVDVAFDRYAEVARAVERTLKNRAEGPALGELPWVIAEIAEPSAVALIARFLTLKDPTLVASAAEALAALGDPSAVPMLTPLLEDKRPVELDEFEGEVAATLGELIGEVIDALSDEPSDDS